LKNNLTSGFIIVFGDTLKQTTILSQIFLFSSYIFPLGLLQKMDVVARHTVQVFSYNTYL